MSPQAGWILQEEVVPRLRSAVPKAVRPVAAEDAEELVQDATVFAAQMMHRNELKGKQVTPGNIAYYTILHMKSGRRANGSSVVDVMATGAQLNGNSRINSFSEVVCESECGNEIFELEDVISNDHEDPGTIAARKLDWDAFMASLSKMELLVVEFMSAGKTLREAGRSVGSSDSTMQTYRKKVGQKLLEFMGADILKDIGLIPKWRIGLDCEREFHACLADRRAN